MRADVKIAQYMYNDTDDVCVCESASANCETTGAKVYKRTVKGIVVFIVVSNHRIG